MSEEIRTADANLHALHAERTALRLAAQTAGIVVWLDGDTYHASLNDAEATGATLGAAIVALCARVAEREVTTRADLDTLRNGVVWLGGELARVKAWAVLWKRAAKDERGDALSLARMQAQTYKYFLASCADSEAQRRRSTETENALRAYLKAQRRMLEKWAEGSDELKTALWRDLHACEDAAVAALDRSADAEVARILSMSDDEILAEVRSEGGDPEKIALEGRLTFERARNEILRAELESARAYADEVEQERAELRDRALGILRAARLLVVAWRQAEKNEATARSMGWELYGLLKDWQTCEEMREPGDKPCGVCQICRALVAWKAAYGSPQNDPATE